MPSFKNDYSYLAHPRILKALDNYQNENNIAYGLDIHSAKASEYIKNIFGIKEGSVYFLAGGTQTNMVFITNALKHYEGVISCDTGHINVHESACIEGNGHKIITVKNKNGKLCPSQIEEVIGIYIDEHMVKPKMIYISNSTEIGTVYHKQELIELRKVADKYNLYLFMDGARLGSALTCQDNDVEPSLLGQIFDGFYIGGTKNGCLFGEALVINNKLLDENFRYHIKNKGAMLAKGFAVGIQFEEMFKDNLYFEIARNTNLVAESLKNVLLKHRLEVISAITNQIFVTLNKDLANSLIDKFGLEKWNEVEDKVTVRFVVSFKSTLLDVKEVDDFLLSYLR